MPNHPERAALRKMAEEQKASGIVTTAMPSAVTALLDQIDELEAKLKPFADMIEYADQFGNEGRQTALANSICQSDCNAARDYFAKHGQGAE